MPRFILPLFTARFRTVSLEQMNGAGNHFQPALATDFEPGRLIEEQDLRIVIADNQQCGNGDLLHSLMEMEAERRVGKEPELRWLRTDMDFICGFGHLRRREQPAPHRGPNLCLLTTASFRSTAHSGRRMPHGIRLTRSCTRMNHQYLPGHQSPTGGTGMIAALTKRFGWLLPVEWLIPRWREAQAETVLTSLGAVEIRHTIAGCFVQTQVKGDAAQAREIALHRLVRYLHGDNQAAVSLDATRPVIQQQLGPRRWLISVRLATVDHPSNAPVPLAPELEVVAREAKTLAVIEVAGRPTFGSITGGDEAVLEAIANTQWIAAGAPRTPAQHARGGSAVRGRF